MGERPDEVRRGDPRRGDPLDEDIRDPDPLVDPVGGPEEVRPTPDLDPALPYEEVGITRYEAEPSRAYEARRTGSTVMQAVRQNPVPAALTAVGLGWLLMNARRHSSSGQERYRDDRAYYPSYDYPPSYEKRGSSVPSAGEALDRAQSRVGESAGRACDTVGESAGRAQDQVSRLGEQAQYQSRRAGDEFQRLLRENPLTVGALAAGVGAGVGLALPQSSQEHEVMGEARDTLVESAQERAQEAQQKVQRVAEEAQSAAREEAENQGLTQEQE